MCTGQREWEPFIQNSGKLPIWCCLILDTTVQFVSLWSSGVQILARIKQCTVIPSINSAKRAGCIGFPLHREGYGERCAIRFEPIFAHTYCKGFLHTSTRECELIREHPNLTLSKVLLALPKLGIGTGDQGFDNSSLAMSVPSMKCRNELFWCKYASWSAHAILEWLQQLWFHVSPDTICVNIRTCHSNGSHLSWQLLLP